MTRTPKNTPKSTQNIGKGNGHSMPFACTLVQTKTPTILSMSSKHNNMESTNTYTKVPENKGVLTQKYHHDDIDIYLLIHYYLLAFGLSMLIFIPN